MITNTNNNSGSRNIAPNNAAATPATNSGNSSVSTNPDSFASNFDTIGTPYIDGANAVRNLTLDRVRTGNLGSLLTTGSFILHIQRALTITRRNLDLTTTEGENRWKIAQGEAIYEIQSFIQRIEASTNSNSQDSVKARQACISSLEGAIQKIEQGSLPVDPEEPDVRYG